MRFAKSIGGSYAARIPFNSLYEILFEHDPWFKSYVTFNSLYEIHRIKSNNQ